MRIHLDTIGCRLNEAEIQSWARAFTTGGHRVVGDAAAADVIVLNTCAVTGEAARKSRQFVRRVHRRNPGAKLVVTGCYAELERAEVASITGVDLVLGNDAKDALVARVAEALDLSSMPDLAADPDPDGTHLYGSSRTRAFVKVQDGCRHRCTFCIVTVARGAERSRPADAIIDEIHALLAAGRREVVLTGVHLGGYGRDLGTDLHGLVESILANTDVPRLRLSSLEPWDLRPDFWSLWKNPRLMPHLHLPLQSGCDGVLRRMGRRCDTRCYETLVCDARAAISGLTLTTDVIVGFPGETDSEWAQTMAFVERIGFGHLHIFAYSPRDGTAAARMPDPVPPDVKRSRSRQLHALGERMKAEHLERFVGQTRPVLWETRSSTASPAREHGAGGGSATWSGYTDNYLRVEIAAAGVDDLRNRITPALLNRRNADTLVAEI
jgi:threonylcarbamoyladenosine tRNA methylthiotransferase MtaB